MSSCEQVLDQQTAAGMTETYLGTVSTLQHVSSIIQGQACGRLAVYGHDDVPGFDTRLVSWAARSWCDYLFSKHRSRYEQAYRMTT